MGRSLIPASKELCDISELRDVADACLQTLLTCLLGHQYRTSSILRHRLCEWINDTYTTYVFTTEVHTSDVVISSSGDLIKRVCIIASDEWRADQVMI